MFNKVEPIPIVGVAPDSDPVTCIALNTSWVEILVGLCEKAYWPGFWAGTPEEVDQALSHVIQLAGMMVGGECQNLKYAKLFELSSGDGGSSIVGWQTRALTHHTDHDDIVTLSSNLFTPIAGKYIVQAAAPAYAVGRHRIRIWDETQSRAALMGISLWAGGGSSPNHANLAYVCGIIETEGEIEYSLDHYTQLAQATYGLGTDTQGTADNQYGTVELFKLS